MNHHKTTTSPYEFQLSVVVNSIFLLPPQAAESQSFSASGQGHKALLLSISQAEGKVPQICIALVRGEREMDRWMDGWID